MELATVVTTSLRVVGIAMLAIQVLGLVIVVVDYAFRSVRSLVRIVAAAAAHVREAAHGRRSWAALGDIRGVAGRDVAPALLWLACAVVIAVAEAIVIHPSVGGDVIVGVTMAFPAVWLLGILAAIGRALLELRAPAASPSETVEPGAKTLAA